MNKHLAGLIINEVCEDMESEYTHARLAASERVQQADMIVGKWVENMEDDVIVEEEAAPAELLGRQTFQLMVRLSDDVDEAHFHDWLMRAVYHTEVVWLYKEGPREF